jgi:hypothetical protein
MHVICTILFANMQDENAKDPEFIENGIEREMTWMSGFIEARKEEEAKARDPFREYWAAHQEEHAELNREGDLATQ